MKTPAHNRHFFFARIIKYFGRSFNQFADFVANPPKPCSLKQLENRNRFKRAIRYAKMMTRDSAGLLKYSHAASRQNIRSAFHAAFKDYMKNEALILNTKD